MGLRGDASNLFDIKDQGVYTHLRVNIFPDGGFARLRAYGEVSIDWGSVATDAVVDLLAVENGGKALLCNDEHYGGIRFLNRPGRGVDMGDGWETRRRQAPGFDWVIFKLGHAGEVQKVEIDTIHFKGNYPDRVAIHGAYLPDDTDQHLGVRSIYWKTLLPPQTTQANRQHYFESELESIGPITHARLDIFPDGGLSRMRLFGLAR